MAASVFANATGPRSTASETVVARVIRPDRSITPASAVGPSSQAVWKDEVVVGRDGGEAVLPGGIHGPLQPS